MYLSLRLSGITETSLLLWEIKLISLLDLRKKLIPHIFIMTYLSESQIKRTMEVKSLFSIKTYLSIQTVSAVNFISEY